MKINRKNQQKVYHVAKALQTKKKEIISRWVNFKNASIDKL